MTNFPHSQTNEIIPYTVSEETKAFIAYKKHKEFLKKELDDYDFEVAFSYLVALGPVLLITLSFGIVGIGEKQNLPKEYYLALVSQLAIIATIHFSKPKLTELLANRKLAKYLKDWVD